MKKNSNKPVFPKWLRRLDPTLEAAETNAVFQAFLSRYKHDNKLFYLYQLIRIHEYIGWRIPLSVIILLLIAMPIMGTMAPLYLITPLCLIILLKSTNNYWASIKDKFPASIHQMLSNNKGSKSVTFDLWMSGNSGKDMIEAAYLERRLAFWLLETALFFITATGLVLWYIFFRRPLCLITFLTLISFILISIRGISDYFHFQPKLAKDHFFKDLLLKWEQTDDALKQTEAFFKRAYYTLKTFLLVPIISAVIILFVVIAIHGIDAVPYDGWFGCIFADTTYFIDCILFIGFLTLFLILRADHTFTKQEINTAWKSLMTQSNYAFENYINYTILKDEDGIAWTQWFYNHQSDRKKTIIYWVRSKSYLYIKEELPDNKLIKKRISWEELPVSPYYWKKIAALKQMQQEAIKKYYGAEYKEGRKQLVAFENDLVQQIQSHLGHDYKIIQTEK